MGDRLRVSVRRPASLLEGTESDRPWYKLHVDSPESVRQEAEELLRALAGPGTTLREDQWTAIEALVLGRRRVLCVQRTGWGKSAVYFTATALLRRRGLGPSLIVSPLLALMRNQIDAASRAGIAARTINSSNLTDWNAVYDEILENTVDVLLVSPERLTHPDFRDYILPKLTTSTGLVVIDEAHCISDWGHDFRPDYRRIRSLLATLAPGIPVLATTATANERVTADVADQLGDTLVLRGPLDRESLRLAVISLPRSAHRLAWLAEHLDELPGSGIIYTLTIGAAEQATSYLRARGHAVAVYSSEVENDERRAAEIDLIDNKLKALVATSALGMGFDKSDLGFVVHLGAPPSPISYYQQIGRAGRAIDQAFVVLLPSDQDLRIWKYFALLGFPPEDQVRVVLDSLEKSDRPLSIQALEAKVDLSHGQLKHMLKVLDVDGAVRRVEGGWMATGAEWKHDTARFERVSAARTAEQNAMLKYFELRDCRLRYLRDCLDDRLATACGRCDNCAGMFVSREVTTGAIEHLDMYLGRAGIEITPRALWPTGLPSIGIKLSGRIAPEERALAGRAIGRLTDMGWGETLTALLSDGSADTAAPEAVLNAAHALVADWLQDGAVSCAGIVGLQSRRRPNLLNSVREGLAERLRLPVLGTLAPGRDASMGRSNNARRVAALHNGFAVSGELEAACRATSDAILLVDDVIDSGWTMTLAARALRRAGAANVMPFGLATTGRRD